MTLSEWREQEGLTRRQAAEHFGCTVEAVRRYETGERIPDRDTMPVIVDKTDGLVTPNDFFGITGTPQADAA